MTDAKHEAPAEDDDGPCTCCDDTGITIQTERPCACAAGIPFEAPAEGAGKREEIARIVSAGMVQERAPVHGGGFMVLGLNMSRAAGPFDDWDDAHAKLVEIRTDAILALRARSSAPEARSPELSAAIKRLETANRRHRCENGHSSAGEDMRLVLSTIKRLTNGDGQ